MNRGNFIISLIMGILFLSGTVYLIEQWKFLQPFMLLGSLMFIMLIFLLSGQTFRINTKLFVLISLFFTSCLVSSLLNRDIYLLEGSIIVYFIYISLVVAYPSLMTKEQLHKQLLFSYLLFHMPILLVPILLNGMGQIPYSGIFTNSNSLGTIAATTFIVIFARTSLLIDNLIFNGQFDKGKLLINFGTLIGIFVLMLYSNSRTSILTVLMMVMVYTTILFSKLIVSGKLKIIALMRVLALTLLLGMFGFIFVVSTGVDKLIETTIVNKMERSSGDELSGRKEIWKKTIDDMKFFGNGREYFQDTGTGAHSTYMSILGQYGLISAMIFIIFIGMGAYYSYIYSKTGIEDIYRYLPLYSICTFIIMSITEGMLFKAIMLIGFCTIGTASTNRTEMVLEGDS